MEYIYSGKITSPNLSQIHQDVTNSAMADKTIEWCRWDEASQNLKIVFTNSISAGDKDILDNIVTNIS